MAFIVQSPVNGRIWKIEIALGDRVNSGDDIIMLEAMNREVPVEVKASGTVTAIVVEEGDEVHEGDALAKVE